MGFKKSVWNVLSLSLIIIIPVLLYNVGSTAILTESRTHPEPVESCNSQGLSSNIEFSQNGIKTYEERGNTVIIVPEGKETTLRFPQTSVKIVDSSGFNSNNGTHTTIENEKSKIEYSVEGSQIRAFDKIHRENYTVLPVTSDNTGYNVDTSRNSLNRLFYTGEEYTPKSVKIGCQKFEYFAPGSNNIDTYEKMLERVSGRIPFDNNYSDIKIILVDDNIEYGENEVQGISYSNIIFIEKGNNTRSLLIHEYIHTRQDYRSFNNSMQRPWFTEGTAQYHAVNSMKDAGYLNRYEYNFRINRWLNQADNSDANDAYLSDKSSINHYALGPKIFHDYETKFGDVESYKNREKSISNYYRNYNTNGGNCSTYICKAISTFLGYIHEFHRYPILYVAVPAYIALLEGIFIIKDVVTS